MTAKKVILAAMLVGMGVSLSQAMGHKPDDEEKDTFPDYNRMEMHPKPANPQPPPSPVPEPEKQVVPVMPSLNTPVNAASDVDAVPKPPPAAVPTPADSSEPPMPDDLIGAPSASTSTQK